MTNSQNRNKVSRREFTMSSFAVAAAPGLMKGEDSQDGSASAAPEAAPTAVETRKPTGWEEGTSIPAEYYVDPKHFEHDERHLADNFWHMVDHVSRIPKAGDYFTFEFGRAESIIILRDEQGKVHAFHNVCRHRGSRLCRADAGQTPESDRVSIRQLSASGNTPLLRCPYHGWTYDLQGSLIKAYMMQKDFDRSKSGLRRCHLRVEGGIIFVNFSRNETPPDFENNDGRFLGFANRYGFADLKVGARRSYAIKANWKLVVENLLECYHCGPAHESLVAIHNWDYQLTDDERAYRHEEMKTWIGGPPRTWWAYEGELNPGFVTGSLDGKPVAPLLPNRKEWSHETANHMTSGLSTYWQAYDDHVVVGRFIPRDTGLSECEVLWLVHPDAVEGKHFEVDRLTALWDTTFQEDMWLIENQHLGVASSGYRPGRLGTDAESSVVGFGKWYMTAVARS